MNRPAGEWPAAAGGAAGEEPALGAAVVGVDAVKQRPPEGAPRDDLRVPSRTTSQHFSSLPTHLQRTRLPARGRGRPRRPRRCRRPRSSLRLLLAGNCTVAGWLRLLVLGGFGPSANSPRRVLFCMDVCQLASPPIDVPAQLTNGTTGALRRQVALGQEAMIASCTTRRRRCRRTSFAAACAACVRHQSCRRFAPRPRSMRLDSACTVSKH